MNSTAFTPLEDRIAYHFRDKTLLEMAMTHSSMETHHSYERLEFLGDRVVGLAIADLLYKTFPDEVEGNLAKRHAALVQGHTLADIAIEIGLGKYILFSDAERAAGGHHNKKILADCVESLIGAAYLDGGYDACYRIIPAIWGQRINHMDKAPREPKTALQEWAQSRALPLPSYEIISTEGPDHAPIFEIRVTIEGLEPVTAKDHSRRGAEKKAAALLLDIIEKEKHDR
ncbi:MAG: ribonuclease III [Alphaproteobacteria bacterium]|jgi:ribonuclease-3|nr:ribonuclease III [Alphaproteobacteria bacterium]MDP7222349.1 ribonuclease III [Alphaproteobacteria bacterium]